MYPRPLLTVGLLIAGFVALPAHAQHAGHAFIAAWDGDKDGKITAPEYAAARAQRFKASDANADGGISEDEYVGEYAARLDKELATSDRSEESKREERTRQIRQTHVRFGVLDTDKDGKIGRVEYDRVAERAFAEQDADKDGVVTTSDAAHRHSQ